MRFSSLFQLHNDQCPVLLLGVAGSSESHLKSDLDIESDPAWEILVAACVTHPLDLTKLRMQTVSSSGAGPSTLKVLRDTVALTGVRSLYTGLSASVLRQMTYSLVRLGSYEGIKSSISKGTAADFLISRLLNCALIIEGKQASTGQLLIAAGLAGGLGGIAGNPAGKS